MSSLTQRVALAALGALLSGAALLAQDAKPATPRIHAREARQQSRIAEGVKSGQLTPKETAKLERQEAKIHKDVAAAKADGKVTAAERARIRKEQNRESRRIARQKHDAQTRK